MSAISVPWHPWVTTAVATWAIALVQELGALISLRSAPWIGRGFRGPLRDYLLADAVEPTHYGHAYGLERAGDMLGAVMGPLMATLLIWGGIEFRMVILWTLVPGLLAAGSMFFLTSERAGATVHISENPAPSSRRSFARLFRGVL